VQCESAMSCGNERESGRKGFYIMFVDFEVKVHLILEIETRGQKWLPKDVRQVNWCVKM